MKKDTVNVDKVIKNVGGKRIAVSWPSNEDLPEGVLEGRVGHNRSVSNDLEVKNEEIETTQDVKVAEPKKVVKKRVRKVAAKK